MLKTSLKRHPSCFDSNFKYTPASQTDLAKTFARIRREQLEQKTPAPVGNVRILPIQKGN
jgi:hypothetical protein